MKIKAEISVIIDTATLVNPDDYKDIYSLSKLARFFLYEDITQAIEDGEFDDLVEITELN